MGLGEKMIFFSDFYVPERKTHRMAVIGLSECNLCFWVSFRNCVVYHPYYQVSQRWHHLPGQSVL